MLTNKGVGRVHEVEETARAFSGKCEANSGCIEGVLKRYPEIGDHPNMARYVEPLKRCYRTPQGSIESPFGPLKSSILSVPKNRNHRKIAIVFKIASFTAEIAENRQKIAEQIAEKSLRFLGVRNKNRSVSAFSRS